MVPLCLCRRLLAASSWWVVIVLVHIVLPRPISCYGEILTDLQCLRSSDPSLEQRLRLEAVKHEILLRLGLNEPPPNPVRTLPDPTKLKEYEAVRKVTELTDNSEPCATLDDSYPEELEVFFPKSVLESYPIVHPSDNLPPTRDLIADTYRIKFAVDLRDTSEIIKAEFRFYRKRRSGLHFEQLHHLSDRVELYLISRPENYYESELREFITGLFVTPETEGYSVFNVSEALDSWLNYHPSRFGEMELEVWIRCPEAVQSGAMFSPNIQFVTDNTTTQLVITGLSEEHANKVDKRATRYRPGYCEDNPDAYQCCLRPLEINFERDFNWTWILEPRSIPFNYCKGSCPVNWNFYSRHSDLITLLRVNNPTAAPEPCCVANSYERKPILAHLEGKNRVHNLDDVVVKSCVCR